MEEILVGQESSGQRIDVFLASNTELSRSAAANIIAAGEVFANGVSVAKSYRVCTGETISYSLPAPPPTNLVAENIPLDIVFEDEDLLVVNKPQGMVVHPAAGHWEGTLANALMGHCKDTLSTLNGEFRPGIVHRIDKDTSGLLIVAKNDVAHRGLAEQIQVHSFLREYQCVVYGHPKEPSGTISYPIGRHKTDRKKMAVRSDGRNAVTHYRTVEDFDGYAHLSVRLETGRTHQIRVHMSTIGHPVVGDPLYAPGRDMLGLDGQCLHAGRIGFIHPTTGQYLEFSAPVPEYFTKLLTKLRK